MTDTPRPGDKVKVSYETTVLSSGVYCGLSIVDGRTGGVSKARVKILERADDPSNDPSNDPVGTLRSLGGSGELMIKLRPEYWVVISRSPGGLCAAPLRHAHDEVRGCPRVPLSEIEKVFGSGRP